MKPITSILYQKPPITGITHPHQYFIEFHFSTCFLYMHDIVNSINIQQNNTIHKWNLYNTIHNPHNHSNNINIMHPIKYQLPSTDTFILSQLPIPLNQNISYQAIQKIPSPSILQLQQQNTHITNTQIKILHATH